MLLIEKIWKHRHTDTHIQINAPMSMHRDMYVSSLQCVTIKRLKKICQYIKQLSSIDGEIIGLSFCIWHVTAAAKILNI